MTKLVRFSGCERWPWLKAGEKIADKIKMQVHLVLQAVCKGCSLSNAMSDHVGQVTKSL